MTEKKRNPNPFIRMTQQANLEKQKKIDIHGVADKNEQTGQMPKITAMPRATKVMRKAGRGR